MSDAVKIFWTVSETHRASSVTTKFTVAVFDSWPSPLRTHCIRRTAHVDIVRPTCGISMTLLCKQIRNSAVSDNNTKQFCFCSASAIHSVYTVRPRIVHRSVCLSSWPYPLWMSRLLTWMAGYIQKWFWPTHLPVVICPSTSWARCRLISLIRPNDVTD